MFVALYFTLYGRNIFLAMSATTLKIFLISYVFYIHFNRPRKIFLDFNFTLFKSGFKNYFFNRCRRQVPPFKPETMDTYSNKIQHGKYKIYFQVVVWWRL